MGSRYVQVTFQFKDQMSKGMEAAAKKLGGVSDRVQAQYKHIGRLGREWTKVGKSLQSTGATLTKRVTVPIVAAGTASAKLAADFDKSMAQINTLLDDDTHMKGYEAAVLATSDKLGINAKTSAEGMYQTISVLGDHGKTTQKTFDIMAQASKAGGAEVVDAVNTIATAMNGYGEVSDATAQRISDLSFKTVKLGKTSFPELANSMSPLFPLASNLGISYEELYATMSTATTSFAGNTAEATTQIKGLMTGFIKPSSDMAALIEKSGYKSGAAMIKAEGLAGALKIVQKEAGNDGMAKYFGNVRGLTAALGLSGKGMEKFEKHLAEMQNASGATGEALDKMGNTDMAKWNKAVVRAQNAGIKFGKAVLPAITPWVEKFGKAISKAADWFSGLSEGQQQMIVKTLGIAAATGPTLTLLGKGSEKVGGILGKISKLGRALDGSKDKIGAVKSVFPVFGRILSLGSKAGSLVARVAKAALPAFGNIIKTVGKVGAAMAKLAIAHPVITALALGAVLIWKNWDKIKPHLEPVIEKFKQIMKFFKDFKKNAGEKLGAVKDKFGELKDKVGDFKDAAGKKLGTVKKNFGQLKTKVGEFKSTATSKLNATKTKFDELKEKTGELKTGVSTKFDAMKTKFGEFKSKAGETATDAGRKLKIFARSCQNSTSGVKGYLGGLINFTKGTFTGNWRSAWNGVKQIFTSAWNGMKSTAIGALSGISSFVSGIVDKVSSLISKIGQASTKASNVKLPATARLPGNARGTNFFSGGWTRVHEEGGEILNLPRGTQIIPHDVSMRMAEAAGTSIATPRSFVLEKLADTIVVREDADIDRIATALAEKLEQIQGDIVYA